MHRLAVRLHEGRLDHPKLFPVVTFFNHYFLKNFSALLPGRLHDALNVFYGEGDYLDGVAVFDQVVTKVVRLQIERRGELKDNVVQLDDMGGKVAAPRF